MTIPPGVRHVADMVRQAIPFMRLRLTRDELDLAAHTRGNTPLHESLTRFIRSRVSGRAAQPVPSNPIDCKAMMERDRECQWILARLDLLYRSPVSQSAAAQTDDEHPA